MSTQFRRRKKLINPRLQLKVVGILASLACVFSMVQAIVMNLALIKISRSFGPEGAMLMSQLPSILISSALVALGLLLPAMIGVGILITFRIAGPLYRFETHLTQIANGEDPGECRIRPRDELHGMCAAINAAVATLSAANQSDNDASEDESRDERAA